MFSMSLKFNLTLVGFICIITYVRICVLLLWSSYVRVCVMGESSNPCSVSDRGKPSSRVEARNNEKEEILIHLCASKTLQKYVHT